MNSGTGDPVWCSDSPAPRVAVVAALDLEASLSRRLVVAGKGGVFVSGPGPARAFATARRAIAGGAGALISWGLAGGLSPEATTARVVLPDSVRNGTGEWRADAAWRERLEHALDSGFDLLSGPLYSAERVLTTRREKSELAARSGAVAVDMESAAIARAAGEADLPFVALRVVADGPNDPLPENIESLVTGDGRTRYLAILRFLGSPRQIRLLIRLAANSRAARNVLRRVAERLTPRMQ